ncbi:MAG: transposase [Sneathiella sp.]
MERKHRTKQEIEKILRGLENGIAVESVLEKHNISKATLYRWRKRAQKSDGNPVKRLQQVDDENSRLRSLLADAAIEIHALKEKLDHLL